MTIFGESFSKTCDRTAGSALFATLCMILGIVAMVGNSWVVLVFTLGKVTKSSCNVLITNLAILDFLTGFSIFLSHAMRHLEKPSGTGFDAQLFCFVFCEEYPMWTFVNASIFNLLFITFERYLCVVSPFYHKNVFSKRKRVVVRLAIIWILAPICGLYNHFAWETKVDGCDLKKEPVVRLWGGIWALFGLLLLPTILMACAYSQLSLSLRTLPGDQRGRQTNRRITLSCLAVTVTFFFCWAPDELLFFARSLGTLGVDVNVDPFFLKAAYYLGLCNCALNPVLYAFFNPNYRKALMYFRNFESFFQSRLPSSNDLHDLDTDESKSIVVNISSQFQTPCFYTFS